LQSPYLAENNSIELLDNMMQTIFKQLKLFANADSLNTMVTERISDDFYTTNWILFNYSRNKAFTQTDKGGKFN
jgi:hypothetical protein